MNVKKYKSLATFLLTIITAVCLTACSSQPKLPSLAKDSVIVAFGDSLTFGTGAELAESYPAVLEKIIGRSVVNYGIPGEVTSEGLSRLPEILDSQKPALLLLCHGGNDQLRNLNQQQAANNLREMIRSAQKRKVSVLLIAVPAPALSLSPPSMYREIAEEFSVPIEEKSLSSILADSSLKSDYIHPNAAGYRRLAESIATLLRKSGAID
ncbi:MAG: arylesterase [Deltaproteobacteria bacterium]|nr:arylesterase [Deltaproteobacteria bacterium]